MGVVLVRALVRENDILHHHTFSSQVSTPTFQHTVHATFESQASTHTQRKYATQQRARGQRKLKKKCTSRWFPSGRASGNAVLVSLHVPSHQRTAIAGACLAGFCRPTWLSSTPALHRRTSQTDPYQPSIIHTIDVTLYDLCMYVSMYIYMYIYIVCVCVYHVGKSQTKNVGISTFKT